jgi:hypothetical protein
VEIAVRRNGRLALQHLTDPRTYREPVCASLAARLHALITRAVEGLRAGFRRGGA